jgi:hypothetical protein
MRPVHSRFGRRRVLRGRAVALALSCALLATPVPAADDEDPGSDPVIPPGEEELIARMLGRGIVLHGCVLVSAGVEYTIIRATYRCPGGDVAFRLAHPRNAKATSVLTRQFAIDVDSGVPPPGFQETLASLVQPREENFEWIWPDDGAAFQEDEVDGDAAE